MSKTTNNKLELINSTFIPKSNNYLYEQDKNILIYSIFSNIVTYNLSNDKNVSSIKASSFMYLSFEIMINSVYLEFTSNSNSFISIIIK